MDLCTSNRVVGYGRIECKTKAAAIAPQSMLRIVDKDGAFHECANTDTTQCSYSQETGQNMPVVTAAALDGASSIALTGTGFTQANWDAKVSFGGVEANNV